MILLKEETLTESWMAQFGAWNKLLLKKMYGQDVNMYAKLPGVGDFAKMFKEEEGDIENSVRNYIVRGDKRFKSLCRRSICRKKLFRPVFTLWRRPYADGKAREVLRQAVSKFESQTGITWPFTDED